MKAVLCCLFLAGCSVLGPPESAQFYKQEAIVTRICLEPLEGKTQEARLQVDPITRRSLFTNSARCYASQIQSVVEALNYPHGPLVEQYSNYRVQLSESRDLGLIDSATALQRYKQSSAEFRQLIAIADQQRQAAAMREFASRLQVFAQTMAVIAAEQERNRQANRQVICSSTGVYRTDAFLCR
jgi:hypothetical protein